VKREKQIFLWSRGEELINHSFPNICEGGQVLPDGLVLDGEILAYHQGKPLAFSVLQRRIGRQDVTDAILSEAPVVFMVYDVLEYQGNDLRNETHRFRRSILDELSQNFPGNFLISPLLDADNWSAIEDLRQQAREELAEGLMLKRSSAIYHVGRKRGDWYKYKVDPLSIDAVLIYAQSGSGKRANLFTAYTFAVWSDDQTELIPIGRAYSGLTNKEIRELDAWIRTNTKQRFGPVRSVDPVQVFELGFDGIMTNERSKSGLSLRFPRMLRWRRDKPVSEADTLSGTRVFLKFEGITEIKRNRSLDDFF
ncbi:MAG: ATP-dependent DNA ligase, partial [Candidatus Kariarchaeaceae archaeon]